MKVIDKNYLLKYVRPIAALNDTGQDIRVDVAPCLMDINVHKTKCPSTDRGAYPQSLSMFISASKLGKIKMKSTFIRLLVASSEYFEFLPVFYAVSLDIGQKFPINALLQIDR